MLEADKVGFNAGPLPRQLRATKKISLDSYCTVTFFLITWITSIIESLISTLCHHVLYCTFILCYAGLEIYLYIAVTSPVKFLIEDF